MFLEHIQISDMDQSGITQKNGGHEDDMPTSPVRKNIDYFENKYGLKKRLAPAPPGQQVHLPKIGNYKPKTLLKQTSVESGTKSPTSPREDGFFFGEIDANDNKKGDAETDHVNGDVDGEKFTENPLFGKSEPNSPLTPYSDPPLEPGVDNPAFTNPPVDYPVNGDSVYSTIEPSNPIPPPRKKKSSKSNTAPPPPPESPYPDDPETPEEDYPYIPEPDYDVDITTKRFPNGNLHHSVSAPDELGVSEYGGEDYSQYFSDEDDDGFYESYTARGRVKYKRKNVKRPPGPPGPPPPRPVSAAPVKPVKINNKRQEFKPIGKQNGVHEIKQRNTIRDFSFSDSKIGYDDRTVRSTTAKGRYMKHGKERPRIETNIASYEEFLHTRHTENGSNSSADSGHETGEEAYLNNIYNHSQPHLKDGKSSLWKKLTWRFRRRSTGYDLG